MSLVQDFKTFLLRGNVIDLAVAVVIGAAFTAVVTAFVAGIITPLIAAIFGEPSFGGLTFTINGSVFTYGLFLNALISFVLVAAVLFFLVIKPVNVLIARSRREPTPDPPPGSAPSASARSRSEPAAVPFAPPRWPL